TACLTANRCTRRLLRIARESLWNEKDSTPRQMLRATFIPQLRQSVAPLQDTGIHRGLPRPGNLASASVPKRFLPRGTVLKTTCKSITTSPKVETWQQF